MKIFGGIIFSIGFVSGIIGIVTALLFLVGFLKNGNLNISSDVFNAAFVAISLICIFFCVTLCFAGYKIVNKELDK